MQLPPELHLSQHNSQELKKLQREWDEKLKKSGFQEIENRENGLLKVWHSYHFQKQDQGRIESQSLYYEKAWEFFHRHPFKDLLELRIWELHCEGLSLRQIAKELRLKTCRAYKVICVLKELMNEVEE